LLREVLHLKRVIFVRQSATQGRQLFLRSKLNTTIRLYFQKHQPAAQGKRAVPLQTASAAAFDLC
jgi:hypothetical protein